jgi:IPT/TIG domain
MAISITPPQPGDLITANLMKQFVDALTALDVRIKALEDASPGTGGTLHISSIDSDVILGGTLTIRGVNFGLPTDNVVTFDSGNGVVPSAADGSNDQLIVVKVPLLPLTTDGQLVTVTVSNNRTGQDSRQVSMHQPAATKPTGSLSVGGGAGPAGNITAGGSYVFSFNLTVITTLDETFTLQPSIPVAPGGDTPWQAVMVADATGTTQLPTVPGSTPTLWQMRIPKTGATPVTVPAFMKVTIPSPTSISDAFVALTVKSLNNSAGFTGGGSPQVKFTVGSALPANQTIQFGSAIATGGSVSGNTATFTVPTPVNAGVVFSLPNLKAGVYQIGLTFDGAANGWGAKFDIGATQIRQFTLAADGNHLNELIDVAATSVSADGKLNIMAMTPPPTVTPPFRQPTEAELAACKAFGVFPLTLTKKT